MNNSEPFGPPVAETSDYVGVGVLAAMLCIGGPLNVLSLLRSLGIDAKNAFARRCRTNVVARERHRPRPNKLTLNFHLTVANLLVIWVYVLSEVCWRLTYQWLGGDALCRLVRFVHAFCFYATSNLVSTIALDRLYVAVRIDRPGDTAARTNAVRWFANCAWTAALICSVPQLFVWRTYEAFPEWTQCVTIWKATRSLLEKNATTDMVSGRIWPAGRDEVSATTSLREQRIEEAHYHERLYNGLHLVFVFWLPVFLIVICYTLIVTRFHRDIRKTRRNAASVEAPKSNPASTATPKVSRLRRWRSANQTPRTEVTRDTTRESVTFASGSVEQSEIDSERRRPENLFRCCLGDSGGRGRVQFQRHSPTARVPIDHVTVTNDAPVRANFLNAAVIGAGQPLLPNNFAASTLMRAKRRTVRKSFWIILSYFVCWFPYNFVCLWRYFDPSFEHFFLEILIDLIVLNAVVNPLIYGI